MMNKDEIKKALVEVTHPAKNDRDIVSLGMVDNISINGEAVVITLVFKGHRDPLTDYLMSACRAVLVKRGIKDVKVDAIVKEQSQPKKAGLDLGLEQLAGVKHIIGVASGKGGVGKSTVSVNLAIALARLGYKVGLADADVYGPSIPKMTATEGEVPTAMEQKEGPELIVPIEKYGVKWMSIGYFAREGQALIWRGPMACNALKQMILQVKWDELDVLLIDMPPGTGDIHISLVHDIPMEGAVIVTTPQKVALADVEKGIDMFRNPNVNKPIYGIVENMAWFTPAEYPDKKYFIFGKGGAQFMADKYGIDILGQVPLVQGICEDGDNGEPSALGSRPDSVAFLEMASSLVSKLG